MHICRLTYVSACYCIKTIVHLGTVTRAAKHRLLCALPEPAVNNAVQGVRKVPDATTKAAGLSLLERVQSHSAGEGLSLSKAL